MSESLFDDKTICNDKGDMYDLTKNIAHNTNWTLAILLVILFVLINSDAFISEIMEPIGGETWVDGYQTTNAGTMFQATVMGFSYLVFDWLKQANLF